MLDELLKSYFSSYKDDITGMEFSLYDLILDLTRRIDHLENENIGLTNELYELQNSVDSLKYQQSMLESKFD